MKKSRIGILTGGGDCAGINPAIRPYCIGIVQVPTLPGPIILKEGLSIGS